jgi:hypothetical protein
VTDAEAAAPKTVIEGVMCTEVEPPAGTRTWADGLSRATGDGGAMPVVCRGVCNTVRGEGVYTMLVAM